MNQDLIKKLQNGEIAVENNNTEALRIILKEAFPNDPYEPKGVRMWYTSGTNLRWTGSDYTCLPTYPTQDFLQPSFNPKLGDEVMVRNDRDEWTKRIETILFEPIFAETTYSVDFIVLDSHKDTVLFRDESKKTTTTK